MPDDLDGVRGIIQSHALPKRWDEQSDAVRLLFIETMKELKKGGFDGRVDELEDGRVMLALILPNGDRPCLLIGPPSIEAPFAQFSYGTIVELPEDDGAFGLSGTTKEGSLNIQALDRSQLIPIVEQFLARVLPS